MSAATAAPEPETAADQRAQDAQYYRGLLHGMLEAGADLNRLIQMEAQAQLAALAEAARQGETPHPAPAPPPARGPRKTSTKDLAAAYDRLTRSMRRSMMLCDKFAAEAAASQGTRQRTAARKRIIRGVEDAIQRDTEGEAAEALHGELLDRLDSPDLEDDIGDRPVAEIIADICRDLGLARAPGSHPWKRRTPADIAVLRARAARPPAGGATRRRPVPAPGATPAADPDPPAPGAAGPSAAAPPPVPSPPVPPIPWPPIPSPTVSSPAAPPPPAPPASASASPVRAFPPRHPWSQSADPPDLTWFQPAPALAPWPADTG